MANLGAYSRILNDETKEELGWKSPYAIYFGRKSNTLIQGSLDKEAEQKQIIASPKPPAEKDTNTILITSRNGGKGHISPLRD